MAMLLRQLWRLMGGLINGRSEMFMSLHVIHVLLCSIGWIQLVITCSLVVD
uniref:Uncharacterized protein n=1 Tax=Anguilla anguilla TaxID=7936 RepID=A0A0E9W4N7_ANGAN